MAEPLVWPVVTKLQPGAPAFAGHTDTVPDIVGRIGTPPGLAIFTEGNHLMALLSDDIVGAFPSWAKSQPRYAGLDLENIVVVTLPQPIVVQMIRTGAIALAPWFVRHQISLVQREKRWRCIVSGRCDSATSSCTSLSRADGRPTAG